MGAHGGAREGAGRKPGAVSDAKREMIDAAQGEGVEVLKILGAIARDEKAPASARVAAACAILDRGFGKPPQALQSDGEGGRMIVVISGDDANL